MRGCLIALLGAHAVSGSQTMCDMDRVSSASQSALQRTPQGANSPPLHSQSCLLRQPGSLGGHPLQLLSCLWKQRVQDSRLRTCGNCLSVVTSAL